jgi:DNA-binding NtrC family response regulator
VLEDRQVRPVGGLGSVPIDVRVIAATNQDLLAMVRGGEFREDLYYRLNGTVLVIPPLRERRREIPSLARSFARKAHGSDVRFADGALRMLREHDWPGNVRELKNVVERACVLAGGATIEVEHLAIQRSTARVEAPVDPRAPIKNAIEELEKKRIVEALEECGGNQSEAAKLLGMSRKTFVRRLDQYNIPRPRKGRDE